LEVTLDLPTALRLGRMEEVYSRFGDQVEFFLIYVREAHPSDGWQVDSNVEDDIIFKQHQTFEDRQQVATTCTLGLNITIPTLIEEMDNVIDEAYGAAPVRLYVIGTDGKVAYHGGAGPHFMDVDEWEEAIASTIN
jgi:hypothetical protein